MIKKVFLLSSFLFIFSSFSLPTHLDCGKIRKGTDKNKDETFWNIGLLAFNGASELSTLFVYLKHTYNIDTIVETGTHHGNTTRFFSHLFDEVHTIEIVDSKHQRIKEKLSLSPNIHFYLGSSDEVLKELLPTMRGTAILFYLDAHGKGRWPLRNELIEISNTHRDNCLIVIDDIQVPGREDIRFDQYGGNACSYAYIRTQLDGVYSDYTMHYIIPENVSCRAKLLVIPTSFSAKS